MSALEIEAAPANSLEATERAQTNTLLSPRFYTTDFDAMDRIDISLVKKEWDALMEEIGRAHV